MAYQLNKVMVPHNLQDLVQMFTIEEIEEVARHLPLDKAPGPDGFNGQFIRKSWSLIKYDFYRLCSEFHSHAADLQSINYSYITLVPKKVQSRKGSRL